MRIPPYWAKQKYEGVDEDGHSQSFAASGWSFTSLADAKNEALARARRVFEALARDRLPDSYDYFDRPIKEEILNEVNDGDTPIAMITRNRYGAVVLNTARVMFVDVDFPKPRGKGLWERISLMFSGKKRDESRMASMLEAVEGVKQWAEANPSYSFRLYRTHSGLRLLFIDRLYEPASEQTAQIFEELGADSMYVKLTQKQECFRARLTSKPWRAGYTRPPNSFPWDGAEDEQAFRAWETRYQEVDGRYKTCELVHQFGQIGEPKAIATVLDIHDAQAKVHATAPLA